MAKMSKGEPRSVPDPDGERYDEMMRQERSKQDRFWGPGSGPPPSFDDPSFPTFADTLDTIRKSAPPTPTVTYGGRTYREEDNGRAGVLVPVDSPQVSQADLAQRRRDVARVLFMADHPLGSVGYDVATLANASQPVRDGALLAGGVADTVAVGAVAQPRPSAPATPPRNEPVESFERPNLRLGQANEKGQAPGGTATIVPSMLGTGSRANSSVIPAGWQGDAKEFNEGRGHIVAKRLGGSGRTINDLVTLEQNGTNNGTMSAFEGKVAKWVKSGEVVEYLVKPLYSEGSLAPTALLMSAFGSRGNAAASVISNPRRRSK